VPIVFFLLHDRRFDNSELLLSQVLLIAFTVGFLAVDLLRLRVNRVKDVFVVLFGSMLRRREFKSLTGGSHLLIASVIVVFIYQPRVFVPAISFLAVGDTAAAIVGLAIGRLKFWGKTVEGTLAGLVCCVAVAWLCSRLSYWPADSRNLPFLVGLVGAVTASAVEALPSEVNDNMAVPIVSGLVMQSALWLHILGA
jgi:glycerol-3-phosphate acyltransferase PlsY